MLEAIGMLTVLTGMGIYFVKSTDLPKDMRDRSAQLRMNTPVSTSAPKKFAFTQESVKNTAQEKIDNERLGEIQNQIRKQALIALHNKKIDELTLLITTLEMEIRENNEKNSEIQKQIDIHLESLRALKETKIA